VESYWLSGIGRGGGGGLERFLFDIKGQVTQRIYELRCLLVQGPETGYRWKGCSMIEIVEQQVWIFIK
jgi:hypothetical protein